MPTRSLSHPFRAARTAVVVLAALFAGGLACTHTSYSDSQKHDRIDELYETYQASFRDTPSISVADLQEELKTGDVVLVDVREPRERAVSTIPGAIDVETFERDADRYKDRTVVTYCTIGARSGTYAESLQRRGFQVRNLRGSILAWTHAHQPLVTGTGETRRVHVYGPAWNLAAQGYEAVW